MLSIDYNGASTGDCYINDAEEIVGSFADMEGTSAAFVMTAEDVFTVTGPEGERVRFIGINNSRQALAEVSRTSALRYAVYNY